MQSLGSMLDGALVFGGYAHRKRGFAGLLAALEDARMSGAMPADVAPEELRPLQPSWTKPRTVEELLGVLERARDGSG